MLDVQIRYKLHLMLLRRLLHSPQETQTAVGCRWEQQSQGLLARCMARVLEAHSPVLHLPPACQYHAQS